MTQYPAVIQLSSLDGNTGFTLSGVATDDEAGLSLSSAGDINGDGFADFMVGTQYAGSDAGAAYVVYGKAGGFAANLDLSALNGTNGFKLAGPAHDYAGDSVASAGDVNGDGFDDMIVGAPYDGATFNGAAFVVFGKAGGFGASFALSGLNGTNGFKITAAAAHDYGGRSVSAGDINGDGFSDLIMGAPDADPNGHTGAGAIYVVFGAASGLGASIGVSTLNGTNGFKLSGVNAGTYTGQSVSSAGDINGDGFDDIVVGTIGGAAFVVFGKASGFAVNTDLSTLNGANGFKITEVTAGDETGRTVRSAGDVNGDGIGDLLVTAYGANGFTGAAYVIFGKTSAFAANFDPSTLNGSNGFKISGVTAGDEAGRSLSSAGDVNGDGFDDVIVGASHAGHNGADSGSSYVVFGKASGFTANLDLSTLDGTNGFRIDGVAANNQSGFTVSSAGDVNGDGLADMLVTADHASPHGTYSGESYLIFGHLPDAAVNRTGTAASQTLAGGNFADTLTGGGGNDKLYGNGGNDLLTGGTGDDYFNGGTGVDTVSYQNAVAGVTISLLLTTPQNNMAAGHDTLVSIEKLVGSAYADTFTAGTAGSTLNGGPGGDDLIGGPGSDILNGGGASDFADYALATAGVTVNLTTAGFQNTVGAGSDELVSIEKVVGSNFGDTITGDAGVNTLFGEGGDDYIDAGPNDDILYGNAGADSLIGGLGQDVMTGGSGSDVFYFFDIAESTFAKPDTITDFTSGQDLIDLSDIDADTTVANDQAFHLGGGGGHAGDIVVSAFDAGNNRTVVSLYVDNNASVDAAIWLTGDHHTLAAGDFKL